MTMNSIPEDAAGLQAFKAMRKQLEYFYERWQDEKEYEDFGDFQAEATKLCANAGVAFKKLTSRPFALTYKPLTEEFLYTVKITARNVTVSRVKA